MALAVDAYLDPGRNMIGLAEDIEAALKEWGDVSSFFFSSRRRHTRWTGDWNSDVCSSDLSITRTTAHTRPTKAMRIMASRRPTRTLPISRVCCKSDSGRRSDVHPESKHLGPFSEMWRGASAPRHRPERPAPLRAL